MQNLELTIKELSDLFEISPRTIRYYEEKGLLESMRKDNNYRIYDINSVNRLETILSLKRSGLTLEKIHDLMNQPSNVKETLYAQKEALDKQMLVLKKVNYILINY